MKIVDAYWEKRNLGRTCTEVHIGKIDSREEVFNVIKSLKGDMKVIFLPAEKAEWIIDIQNEGYRYIETNVDIFLNIERFHREVVSEEVISQLSSMEMTEQRRKELLDGFHSTIQFTKDRISLDPELGVEKSSSRNYFRTLDYIKENRRIYFYDAIYNGFPIGYFILEEKGKGVMDLYLSGVYPDCSEGGYGTMVFYEEVLRAIKHGASMVTTGVSMNNLRSFRIYEAMGFTVGKVMNIFVKHCK